MKKISKKFIALFLAIMTLIGGASSSLIAFADLIPAVIYMCQVNEDGMPGYYVTFPRATSNTAAGDQYEHSKGFVPTGPLTFQNGFKHDSGLKSFLQILTLDDYRRVCYCIEPGISIDKPEVKTIPLNKVNSIDIDWKQLERYNNYLDATEIQDILCAIAYHGFYNETGESITTWRTQNGDTWKIAKAEATQLLIWETIVSERDENFNHIAPPSGYNSVFDNVNPNCPIYSDILSEYQKIESAVKESVSRPGFAYPTVEEAAKDENVISIETKNGKRLIELTDSNTLENYTLQYDSSKLSITKSGNKLEIKPLMNFPEKELVKLTKTYTAKSLIMYSDGLFDPYATSSKQNVIYPTDVKTVTKDYYFYVESPHRHVWIPLTKQPTCVDEGYTVWKCGCGLWSTDDPHTGADSHVAATGHDYANATWIISQKPTCTKAGEKIQLCGKCGTVIDKIPINAPGHDDGVWKIESEATPDRQGQKILCCTKCNEILDTKTFDYHTHTEGHKEIISQPTCTENGSEGVFCSLCNACYKFNDIAKTGHCEDSSIIWVTTVPTACTTAGEAAGLCANCGEILTTKELPASGHSDIETVTTIFPTCKADGEALKICTLCGQTVSSSAIDSTGHDEGVWTVTKKATCTVDGEKSLICKTCGFVIKTQVIEATGHDEGTWKMDYDATPEHNGKESRYCTKCGCVLESKEFPLHTHKEGYRKNVVEPTCTEMGQEGIFCAVCGVQYKTNKLDALEHDYSEYFSNGDLTHSRTCSRCHYVDSQSCTCESSAHAATCIDYGYTKHTCTVCGYNYKDNFASALGHDWSRFVDDENGTSHTAVCERCGISESSAHLWSEWRLMEKNVLERTAKYQRKCEVCGALQVDVTNLIDDPHVHTMEKFDAVPNTCTEDGREEYYHCTDPDCDAYFSDPDGEHEIEEYSWIIPAHGHNYVEKENVPPTCTEDGYIYHECTHDASHNHKEVIPAHGHNYVEKERVEPTCTEDGYIYYECTHDASHNYKKVIPAHDHDYHLIPEKCKQATEEEPGYYYYECSHDPSHYYLQTISYVGNMGTGKSADYDEETGVATITLNSSTDTKEVSYKQTTPLDIVLVVDQSGSMASRFTGSSKTKQQALIEAANAFVNNVSKEAAESGADHRIAVVGFAMGASSRDGIAAYKNTAILTTGGNPIQMNRASDSDYANALMNVNVGDKLNPNITKAINGIKASGATAADFGLEMAKLVFDNTVSENRQKVVVFMTDGSPTYSNGFETEVANSAIRSANVLKSKYSAAVYSVGVAVDKAEKMTNFMNSVSSNYPSATSLDKMGKSGSDKFYITADNEQGLNDMFKTIEKDVVTPSKPFEDITLVDTVSKEFTMTVEQENALRQSVCNEYGITNNDISVTVNEDGTTTIEIRHLNPKTTLDASGKPVKYYVNVTFSVTANQYAQGKSYYNTNTDYAGVIIDGVMIDKFSSPRVSVSDGRNIVAFTVGDEVYAISSVNIGDEIASPGFDFIEWDIPEGFTVSEKYTEITGSFISDVKTVTWNYAGGSITENYHVGERIRVFDTPVVEGKLFLGWDSVIPFEMGSSNLTFTAQYMDHTHSFEQISQYGLCDEGITYIYGCSCGETYKTVSAPAAHSYSASITNSEGRSIAILSCENCGHTEQKYITYQAMFDSEEVEAERENGTGTNQVFDLTMYNASDVSVQPDGSISIIIPATSQMLNDENLKIYRINEDGTRDEIAFEKNADYETLVMTVDHFSYYLITASEEFAEDTTYDKIYCGFAKGHIDTDNDGVCDDCKSEIDTNGCTHMCHSDKWYVRIFWAFIRFFCKVFRIKPTCTCGMRHY